MAGVRVPVPDHVGNGGQQGHARRPLPRPLPGRRSPLRGHRDRACWSASSSACTSGPADGCRCAPCRSAACCLCRQLPHVLVAGRLGDGGGRAAVRRHLPVGGLVQRAGAGPGLDPRQFRPDHPRGQAGLRVHRQRRHLGLDRRRLRHPGHGGVARHRGCCSGWRPACMLSAGLVIWRGGGPPAGGATPRMRGAGAAGQPAPDRRLALHPVDCLGGRPVGVRDHHRRLAVQGAGQGARARHRPAGGVLRHLQHGGRAPPRWCCSWCSPAVCCGRFGVGVALFIVPVAMASSVAGGDPARDAQRPPRP